MLIESRNIDQGIFLFFTLWMIQIHTIGIPCRLVGYKFWQGSLFGITKGTKRIQK